SPPAISRTPVKYRNQSPSPILAKMRIHSCPGPKPNFSSPEDTNMNATAIRRTQGPILRAELPFSAVSSFAITGIFFHRADIAGFEKNDTISTLDIYVNIPMTNLALD